MNMPSALAAVQGLLINRLSEISPLLRTPDLLNHYPSFSVSDFPLENKFLPESSIRLNLDLKAFATCSY